MTGPTTPPVVPTITGWRNVASALRRPELRVPVMLGLAVTAVSYLLCLCAALWTAKFAWLLAVRPGLDAAFGHVPASEVTAPVVITLMGVPAYWGYVRLMYRVANARNKVRNGAES